MERIAYATSRRGRDDDRLRWTEVSIFRQAGGGYLYERVGRSRVYHSPLSSCPVRYADERPVSSLTDLQYADLEPCPRCRPLDLDDLPPGAVLRVEGESGRRVSCATVQDIVRAATSVGRDDVPFVNDTTREALAEAARVDPAFYVAAELGA